MCDRAADLRFTETGPNFFVIVMYDTKTKHNTVDKLRKQGTPFLNIKTFHHKLKFHTVCVCVCHCRKA